MMKQFLINFISMVLATFVPLLIYAIRRADNFMVDLFLLQNKTRIVSGFLLVICLSLGMTFFDGFVDILTVVGITANGTSAGFIGAAIGLFITSALTSDKPK